MTHFRSLAVLRTRISMGKGGQAYKLLKLQNFSMQIALHFTALRSASLGIRTLLKRGYDLGDAIRVEVCVIQHFS